MQASAPYPERIKTLLSDWALLAGHGDRFFQDPRMRMVSENLGGFDPRSTPRSALCADGSPLEFCERISARPQAVALTMEPLRSRRDGESRFDGLYRLLRNVSPAEELGVIKQQLERHGCRVRRLWLGADFAQRQGVRIYCDLDRQAGAEVGHAMHSGAPAPIAGTVLSEPARRSTLELLRRGVLRVLGANFAGEAGGLKLAFAHPLEASSLERIAGYCRIPFRNFQDYIELLSPSGRGWRKKRCGLAISVDRAGEAQGLTVYHYAAPYFLNDKELKYFVLRIADRFRWDTNTYRCTSSLLDRQGERVRSLVGFTVGLDGKSSIRLYGQTGAYCDQRSQGKHSDEHICQE